VKRCVADGHAFVTDVELSAKMFSELAQLIKSGRQGIVLRPGTVADGQGLLFTNTPPASRGDGPGRGVLVTDGLARRLQVGIPAAPVTPDPLPMLP
jgi:hypothetical protein